MGKQRPHRSPLLLDRRRLRAPPDRIFYFHGFPSENGTGADHHWASEITVNSNGAVAERSGTLNLLAIGAHKDVAEARAARDKATACLATVSTDLGDVPLWVLETSWYRPTRAAYVVASPTTNPRAAAAIIRTLKSCAIHANVQRVRLHEKPRPR